MGKNLRGTPQNFWSKVCGAILQNLSLSQTKTLVLGISLQTWALKFIPIFRISDQNEYNLYPISDQNGSKTIHFGAPNPYIAPPPPPPHSGGNCNAKIMLATGKQQQQQQKKQRFSLISRHCFGKIRSVRR